MSSEGYTEVPTSERTSMLFILTVKMGTAADGFGQPVLIMGEKSQSLYLVVSTYIKILGYELKETGEK